MRGVIAVQPGGQGSHSTYSLHHVHCQDKDDFEDIISYIRDYIAICKKKMKDSYFVSLCSWSLKT